jgi:hypothetical protein
MTNPNSPKASPSQPVPDNAHKKAQDKSWAFYPYYVN